VRWRRARAHDERGGELQWIVVRLDLARVTPVALPAPGESLLAAAADPHLVFAVDAGFFDEAHRPAGALINRGRDIGLANPRGGSGILVIRERRADLFDAAAPLARAPLIDLAVQCGPRLVERDGSAGIYRDDGQRYARTAACIRDGGRTLDIVVTWSTADPLRGPGLYAFSRMLVAREPAGEAAGCERALNLDGGPSTGVYVRGAPEATHAPLGPVPWLIAVRDD
jgi:uncharacterized protein YigE (DUF2233 family)